MKELTIPNFVTAKTPDQLRKEMFKKQVELSRKLTFFDISFDGKNWYAWYEISTKIEAFNG